MSDLLKGTFTADRTPTGNMAVKDFLRLIEHWQGLFTGLIAENTLPYRISGKGLYIATLHPTLAQELSNMERDILLKILSHYPDWSKKLEKLHFKYYPGFDIKGYLESLLHEQVLKPSKQVLRFAAEPNLSPMQKEEIKSSSYDIADPELKQLLNALIDRL